MPYEGGDFMKGCDPDKEEIVKNNENESRSLEETNLTPDESKIIKEINDGGGIGNLGPLLRKYAEEFLAMRGFTRDEARFGSLAENEYELLKTQASAVYKPLEIARIIIKHKEYVLSNYKIDKSIADANLEKFRNSRR